MELYISRKGTLATATCSHCWFEAVTHEWDSVNFNDERDDLQDGHAICPECGHDMDCADSFSERRGYVGYYTMPGYLDRTDTFCDTNKRRLERTLRDVYEY